MNARHPKMLTALRFYAEFRITSLFFIILSAQRVPLASAIAFRRKKGRAFIRRIPAILYHSIINRSQHRLSRATQVTFSSSACVRGIDMPCSLNRRILLISSAQSSWSRGGTVSMGSTHRSCVLTRALWRKGVRSRNF